MHVPHVRHVLVMFLVSLPVMYTSAACAPAQQRIIF
jgi:hypothetical protein